MFKSRLNRLIIVSLFAVLACGTMAASDPEDEPPINVPIDIPENPADTPKPKAPSRVRISAYRGGDVLVIRSTVNVTAEIQIIDLTSGAVCFEGSVFLAPETIFAVPAASPIAVNVSASGMTYHDIFQN